MRLASRKPAEAAPPRMGALAKLPVFLDLAGKRALVVGGTAPAAWKAELIAAAGADVVVLAAEVGPEMAALLERGAASGTLTLEARPWTAQDLEGAAIAIADAADEEEEACRFREGARAAGVPVNVIDQPAYCSFQFGSIINRSPIVVGVSTDGAAPILGQAIRRRIETLLPPFLGAWGGLAKRLRAAVADRLAHGAQRRAFWERFSERAFAGPPRAEADREAARLIEEVRTGVAPVAGRVTLVGAGPGDAELLTLKAVRALQAADIILYDDLVSDEVLELARREAKRMLVGKRGRRESCRQDDINALMIRLAREGRRVVRLKSGDPMIFGRAGEEIDELGRHGIAVDVVPGVTSALAVAARLGVSLTHRDCAQSVRFVTGHARDGELPQDLDWRGLADPRTTLVFYMGGRTAPLIARRLIAAGLPVTTPAVAISGATRPDEQRWAGDLAGLAEDEVNATRGAPTLIGIGSAFASLRRDACPQATQVLDAAARSA